MSNLDELVWKVEELTNEIVERTKNGTVRDSYVAEFAKNLSMRTTHATDDLKQFKQKYFWYKAKSFLPWNKNKEDSAEFTQLTKNYGNIGIMLKGIYENITSLALSLGHFSDEEFEALEGLDEEELERKERRKFSVIKLGNPDVKESLNGIVNEETGKTLLDYVDGFFYSENRELYNKHRKAHKDAIKGHILKKQQIMFKSDDVPEYLRDGVQDIDIETLMQGSVENYLINTVEALEAIVNSDLSTMNPRAEKQDAIIEKNVGRKSLLQTAKYFTIGLGIIAMIATPIYLINKYKEDAGQVYKMLVYQLNKDNYPISGFVNPESEPFMLEPIDISKIDNYSDKDGAFLSIYLEKMMAEPGQGYSANAYLKNLDKISKLHKSAFNFNNPVIDSLFEIDASKYNSLAFTDLRGETIDDLFPNAFGTINMNIFEVSSAYVEKLAYDQMFLQNMISDITIDESTELYMDPTTVLSKATNIKDLLLMDLIQARVMTRYITSDEKTSTEEIKVWVDEMIDDISNPDRPFYKLLSNDFSTGINFLCREYDPEHYGEFMSYILQNHTPYHADIAAQFDSRIIKEADENAKADGLRTTEIFMTPHTQLLELSEAKDELWPQVYAIMPLMMIDTPLDMNKLHSTLTAYLNFQEYRKTLPHYNE
jgi:hypothetical protein